MEKQPETYRAIEKIIGFTAAERLLSEIGGSKIYIPSRRPTAQAHWVNRLIPENKIKSFLFHFGGDNVYMPTAPSRIRRRQIVWRWWRGGATMPEIAERVGISRRQAERITRPLREASA